jgi:outer membrane protein assembly factor BamB
MIVDGAVDAPRDARDTSVPEDTAPPIRPACFEPLMPGSVRGTIEDIHGRPAYDGEGNLYAPRLADDEWFLVSYDPCLAVRWALPLGDFEAQRRNNRTSVDADGFVWFIGRFDAARATTDGFPTPPTLAPEGTLSTWVGIPPAGPVYVRVNGTDMPRHLYRTRLDGGTDRVRLEEVSSYVWDGECVVADTGALCWNVAYDLDDLERRYYRDPPLILDGTLRHITEPAFDGERLWTLRFGISTYDLVAQSTRTGEEVVSTRIARTSAGQSQAIMSPPVIGAGGEVLVYFSGSRADGPAGQLEAFSSRGDRLWSYAAPRSAGPDVFRTTSSIAIGDANVAYLAVGATVHAVVVSTGAPRWTLMVLGVLNDPDLQISPLGDIAVIDDTDRLIVIATEALTVGRTPWPVAGGRPSATYAR